MEFLKSAVGIVKKNYVPLMAIALAYSILELGIMRWMSPYMGSHSIMTVFSGKVFTVIFALLLFELVRIIFLAGFLPMIMDSVQGRKVTVASFREFLTMDRFGKMLLLELVVMPIFIVGLILLIIPGVYWFVITIFAYFMVVGTKDVGTLDAISRSISATKGYRWQIFLYAFFYSIISFFASLVPAVSVIVDTLLLPVLYMVFALIYKAGMKKND